MTVLTEKLIAPIESFDGAKAWIQELQDRGLMFHFDDSPETIGNYSGNSLDGAWVDLFDESEAAIIRERLNEVYSPDFDWSEFGCPIGYALHISGHTIEQD